MNSSWGFIDSTIDLVLGKKEEVAVPTIFLAVALLFTMLLVSSNKNDASFKSMKRILTLTFLFLGSICVICSYAQVLNELFDKYSMVYYTEWVIILLSAAIWGWFNVHVEGILKLILLGLLFAATFLLLSRNSSYQNSVLPSYVPGLQCKTFLIVHSPCAGHDTDPKMIALPTEESEISKLTALPIVDYHHNNPSCFYYIYSDNPIGIGIIPLINYHIIDPVNPLNSDTPPNVFHAKITGVIKVDQSSLKKFWIHVDDFISVKIDGQLIAHDFWHGPQNEYSIKCDVVYRYNFLYFLEANRYYSVDIGYTNTGGHGILKLFWENLNATVPYFPDPVPVPDHVFFHEKPTEKRKDKSEGL
jgi:hypothetical protein